MIFLMSQLRYSDVCVRYSSLLIDDGLGLVLDDNVRRLLLICDQWLLLLQLLRLLLQLYWHWLLEGEGCGRDGGGRQGRHAGQRGHRHRQPLLGRQRRSRPQWTYKTWTHGTLGAYRTLGTHRSWAHRTLGAYSTLRTHRSWAHRTLGTHRTLRPHHDRTGSRTKLLLGRWQR